MQPIPLAFYTRMMRVSAVRFRPLSGRDFLGHYSRHFSFCGHWCGP